MDIQYIVQCTQDATHDGVTYSTLANLRHKEITAQAAYHASNPPYIDVYRYTGTLTTQERAQLLQAAEAFACKQDHYATSHLFLLALFVLARRVSKREARRIRHALEQLFHALNRKRTPMVCSESVYRCYAGAGIDLGLSHMSLAHCAAATMCNTINQRGFPDAWERTQQRLQQQWTAVRGPQDTPLGQTDVDPAFVTPHALQTASNLHLVGRLTGGSDRSG